MSHVERKSKYIKLAKLADNSADSVLQACARVLLPLADRIETITYDNGKELGSHAEIATSLGSLSYFSKPPSMWTPQRPFAARPPCTPHLSKRPGRPYLTCLEDSPDIG
jgi:IS30 family transposase